MPKRIFDKGIFAERLSSIMKDNNDTIYSLAEYLHLSPSAISKYNNAEIVPKQITIEKIAEKYGINPVWLMGANVDKYIENEETTFKKIPVVGVIAARTPILAQENIEGYESVSEDFNADFCLKVKGDSMIGARILDGDLVYIRKQPDVENGEIAAILIDDEATLKRVFKVNGNVILHAENSNYPDRIFSKKDMKEIVILGKAIAFKSEVR
jgi:repressor LexA